MNDKGWTHEEAKRHSLIDRLRERCRTYSSSDKTCDEEPMPRVDWCERCQAAFLLEGLIRDAGA